MTATGATAGLRSTTAPGVLDHLLGCERLSAEHLRRLLRRAVTVEADLKSEGRTSGSLLLGKAVGLLFFEDSTRTRMSFSLAAQRGGARVVEMTGPGSSVSKGETLGDTARVIESMGVDALVVRAKESGSAAEVARAVGVPVINAGDGRHEHPTQALIDCFAFAHAAGLESDFDFAGKRLAIVGDVVSSRVARSAIWAFRSLGAEVTLVGPAHLAPTSMEATGAHIARDFDAVLPEMDAAMMLRVQLERHGASTLGPVRDYKRGYALTAERAALMKRNAVVMHPGPMNRGLEIAGEVADSERSIVFKQTAAGVPVRLAALAELLGL